MDTRIWDYGGKDYQLVQADEHDNWCSNCSFNNQKYSCEQMSRYCGDYGYFIPIKQEKPQVVAQTNQGASITKETNPKDAVGIRKAPMSVVPSAVVMEMGLGMMEGARKYGRHNYRKAGVRASVYYDATQRHLMEWWEGTDIDEGSGLSHITKAMTALAVLRDSMMNDMWTDDRPPSMKNKDWLSEMNIKAGEIIDKYPESPASFTKENS